MSGIVLISERDLYGIWSPIGERLAVRLNTSAAAGVGERDGRIGNWWHAVAVDEPPGDGWWQAKVGNWYPPEDRPAEFPDDPRVFPPPPDYVQVAEKRRFPLGLPLVLVA